MDDAHRPRAKAAVLIFAESHERDLRRRGLPVAASPLLTLPRLTGLSGRVDLHWFTDRPAGLLHRSASLRSISIHRQRGKDFAARLEAAVDRLAELGYEQIVIIGRDCPQLTADDISVALAALDAGRRLVIGPDHRGGCWLIGLKASDRGLLRGMRWQRDTDAAELLARAGRDHVELLAFKIDLDCLGDLLLLSRRLTLAIAMLKSIASRPATPPRLRAQAFLRRAVQLPPPTR